MMTQVYIYGLKVDDKIMRVNYLFVVLFQTSGLYEPSLYHALVVIFLEFFAWGLLTSPIIKVSWTTILML